MPIKLHEMFQAADRGPIAHLLRQLAEDRLHVRRVLPHLENTNIAKSSPRQHVLRFHEPGSTKGPIRFRPDLPVRQRVHATQDTITPGQPHAQIANHGLQERVHAKVIFSQSNQAVRGELAQSKTDLIG